MEISRETEVFARAFNRDPPCAAASDRGGRPHWLRDGGAASDRGSGDNPCLSAGGRQAVDARYQGRNGGDRRRRARYRIRQDHARDRRLVARALCGGRRGAQRQIHDHIRVRPRSEPVHGPVGRDQRPGFAVWAARRARVLSMDSGSRSGRSAQGRRGSRPTRARGPGGHPSLQSIDEQLDDLDRTSASRLPFVHVSDAPVQSSYTTEELLHAARVERLPPGEGGIDIKRILGHMPQNIPVALEAPMTTMASADGEEAVALRVRQAAERLLTA